MKQFALVNKRYGYAQIKEGTYLLQLDWPALTLNNWGKYVTLKSGKVYFYKIHRITAPFVFVTSLQSVSEKDAVSTYATML